MLKKIKEIKKLVEIKDRKRMYELLNLQKNSRKKIGKKPKGKKKYEKKIWTYEIRDIKWSV